MHPERFGKYKIVRKLPGGGMGRVYLATDTEQNRPVALKLIDHGSDADSQEVVDAERRGSILQARLGALDPRVTVIYEYGDLDGYFYIAMEFVEGRDLSEVLAEGAIGIPFATRIACDICEVLLHAHNFKATIEGHDYHGIVHGDIKPRNIRVTTEGEIKVLDFGIAKALSLTRKFTHNQFGSIQYSSPERLNTGDVDAASDLWSVGVVLYEMTAGRPYFKAETVPKLEHIVRNYSALQPMPEEWPAGLRAILRKALSPDPALRYASAEAMLLDLHAFREGKAEAAEAAAAGDVEATRRTAKPSLAPLEEDEGRTRRTLVASPAGAAAPVPRLKKKPLLPFELTRDRVKLGGRVLLVLVSAALLLNEILVWRSGAELYREIESERLTDMDAAWARYEELADSNYVPLLLWSPRRSIKQRLTAAADRVIQDYRNNNSPSETDWNRARVAIARALVLDPGDDTLKGKLHLADGHLNRINGPRSAKLRKAARINFEMASDLLRKSPDPYLGLAGLYAYGSVDGERLEEALKSAEKRGHSMGRREKALLADGYRARAEKMMEYAGRTAGLPEEEEYLLRADKDFKKAEEFYQEIVPFGNAAASLRLVYERRDKIGMRLRELKEEG
ncbi:MAG: serine/threonine-protein kinase [Bryobacteraceae bacterium]